MIDYTRKIEYPDTLSTILKRLRRIDPWKSAITAENPFLSALMMFYKMRQSEIKEIRLATVSYHAWTEMFFENQWWIIDPIAVRKTEYGIPLKPKSITQEKVYLELKKYFVDADEYFQEYTERGKIDLEIDEIKIAAQEDKFMSNVFKINHF